MTSMKQVFSLVAVLAFVIVTIASVSAATADITSVKVSGVEGLNAGIIAASAGDTLPVQVTFTALNDAQDVRVKALIFGEQGYSASTDRFDVIANHTYTRTFSVQIPSNIDVNESMTLDVDVENEADGLLGDARVDLGAQRSSYDVEVLNVDMDSQVNAGASLALDVVLKNQGGHTADDAFVVVSIPALGVEKTAYFGDLSPIDQSDPDLSDAAEKKISVAIPSSAATGVYDVKVEAHNGDFDTTVSKKVAVLGATEETMVLSSVTSQKISVGTEQEYAITVVNTGDKVKVYNLVFETASGLTFDVSEPVVVVPAGSSQTVKFGVTADKVGTYNFAAGVYSDGQLVKKLDFVANADKTTSLAGNSTVLLTVILAIVFVVLLVVLIVLLTRKPEKSEEFGESYY